MEFDHLFFDELYALWARTTDADKRFWMPEEYKDGTGRFKVYAVSHDGTRKLIASELRDEDAEFIAGVHGAVPDVVRCLHDATDEADRADYDKDSRECRIAELELELSELKADLEGLIN